MSAKFWYAVYTRPNMELSLVQSLSKRSIEVYCPTMLVETKWSDRIKRSNKPAFKGYIFVHISDERRWEVLASKGVVNFVCLSGKPAKIPVSEMNLVFHFFEDIATIAKEKNTPVRINDQVAILSGNLMGKTGLVKEIHNNQVVLMIPSIGLQFNCKLPLNKVLVMD